jgi:phospholipid/cholesterol/gamma-HCH transport system substrate-binding protein
MDERRLEFKVGALAVLALAIGVALFVALTGVTGGSRFTLYADFAYAGGLPAGAAVKIAGVKVGRVREVTFRADGHDGSGKPLPVRLTLDIDRSAAPALHSDAAATVGMQGALGETYVELQPGLTLPVLAENTPVRGLDPPRLDVLLSKAASVLEGASNEDALRVFLTEVAQLAHNINGVLLTNRDEILQLLHDVTSTVAEARATLNEVHGVSKSAFTLLSSPEVKTIVSDFSTTAHAARIELPGLMQDTRTLVARLEKTTGSLGPEDVQKVRETIARYNELGAQLQKVSANVGELIAAVQRGEGTLGKVTKDPQVYDDLRAIPAEHRPSTKRAASSPRP